MLTYEEEKEAFLAHYGVPGMKWGKRKASTSSGGSKTPKKKMSNEKKDLIIASSLLATAVAVKTGSRYLAKNPQLLARAANKINGTKSIGVGYDVITLAFKNGRWG